jgi:radical SAM superfamily enzyme YgiQ (UPF0313 family)
MRVLLISANTETINMPTAPLGLGLVAEAARRAGHEVRFLDLMFQADPAEALRQVIAAFGPQAIGVSVRNIDDQNMESPKFLLEKVKPVVAECRAATTAPIILGGAGFSIFPDETLAYLGADFGVSGDGETAFPALLEALEAGGDPGGVAGVHAPGRRAIGAAFPASLDALPLPEQDAWAAVDPQRADIWLPIQSRRGCPNDCSYCSTARIQGRVTRLRSPRRVVDHLERLARAGFSRFFFVDNSFNIPESQGLEICREIAARKLNVKWRCIVYPHRLSPELATAMAQAGCVEASLGFESGSDRVLRAMNKHFTPDDVRRVAATLAGAGIRRFGFLLLGGPGEDRATVDESFAFAASLKLDGLKTTVGIRIYPGTPLAERAVADGLIAPHENLLTPHFYLSREVAHWIRDVVKECARI